MTSSVPSSLPPTKGWQSDSALFWSHFFSSLPVQSLDNNNQVSDSDDKTMLGHCQNLASSNLSFVHLDVANLPSGLPVVVPRTGLFIGRMVDDHGAFANGIKASRQPIPGLQVVEPLPGTFKVLFDDGTNRHDDSVSFQGWVDDAAHPGLQSRRLQCNLGDILVDAIQFRFTSDTGILPIPYFGLSVYVRTAATDVSRRATAMEPGSGASAKAPLPVTKPILMPVSAANETAPKQAERRKDLEAQHNTAVSSTNPFDDEDLAKHLASLKVDEPKSQPADLRNKRMQLKELVDKGRVQASPPTFEQRGGDGGEWVAKFTVQVGDKKKTCSGSAVTKAVAQEEVLFSPSFLIKSCSFFLTCAFFYAY